MLIRDLRSDHTFLIRFKLGKFAGHFMIYVSVVKGLLDVFGNVYTSIILNNKIIIIKIKTVIIKIIGCYSS